MHKLKYAIEKYGMDNFKVIILLKCPAEQLNEKEVEFIKYYDSKNNGYNISDGGVGNSGWKRKPEQIEKQKHSLVESYQNKDNKELHINRMKDWFQSQPEEVQNKQRNGNDWWLDEKSREKHKINTMKSVTPERIERQKLSRIQSLKLDGGTVVRYNNIILKSPDGIDVVIKNISEFCKEYKLGIGKIYKFIKAGDINSSFRGWKFVSKEIKKRF